MDEKVEKVIIAVHGIGDQTRFATIQQVVAQFARQFDVWPAVPLGAFYHPISELKSAVQPVSPDERKKASGVLEGWRIEVDPKAANAKAELAALAFAEVYWADIPRHIVKKGFRLEEAKGWARTIVGRVEYHERETGQALSLKPNDFALMKELLSEMLQTLRVLEKLSFLADRMGIFHFDLNKVLNDYLGDVQVVADFSLQSGEIVDRFAERIQSLHALYPKAELYIVAHSEGTVVSLLGLLRALSEATAPGWLKQVRGWMTIGSPIDKHLALWPELFDLFEQQCCEDLKPRIEWRNYYDYGDPVGFKLDAAHQEFVASGKWKAFAFRQNDDPDKTDDIGFGRYLFPGKAHNDYWIDSDVFGHFITNVVYKESSDSAGLKPVARPTDKRWVRLVSNVIPYVGALGLLFTAVFLLYRAVNGYLDPQKLATQEIAGVARYVSGVTALLAGLTLWARLLRLTKKFWHQLAGFVLFGGSIALAWLLLVDSKARVIFVYAALASLIIGFVAGRIFPRWGMYTLLIPGGLSVLGIESYYLKDAPPTPGSLWQVILATAFFLYLWWLVALLFDLVFVWHRYIRCSVVQEKLGRLYYKRQQIKDSRPLLRSGLPLASIPGPLGGVETLKQDQADRG